jgi:hypothetical protein
MLDVRNMRMADIQSDHLLLVAEIRLKIADVNLFANILFPIFKQAWELEKLSDGWLLVYSLNSRKKAI